MYLQILHYLPYTDMWFYGWAKNSSSWFVQKMKLEIHTNILDSQSKRPGKASLFPGRASNAACEDSDSKEGGGVAAAWAEWYEDFQLGLQLRSGAFSSVLHYSLQSQKNRDLQVCRPRVNDFPRGHFSGDAPSPIPVPLSPPPARIWFSAFLPA